MGWKLCPGAISRCHLKDGIFLVSAETVLWIIAIPTPPKPKVVRKSCLATRVLRRMCSALDSNQLMRQRRYELVTGCAAEEQSNYGVQVDYAKHPIACSNSFPDNGADCHRARGSQAGPGHVF
jgi:hypothetical protein